MLNIGWSANLGTCFRPAVRDCLGYFTHPFPSRDGNRRSFIQVADVRRIPQNGVAPFRQEKLEQIEVKWGHMSSQALVSFIGMYDKGLEQ